MSDDFSVFLHELRTRELRRLPPGAKVVLSGGAAGSWYFEWFEENYPSQIERHIGVEALAARPPDLPAHVEWVSSTLGDLGAVPTASVDLVFAGEVIEHLWPDDVAGFLAEAHRVLRPSGSIALDSPNRRFTQATAWLHPEHTFELSVDEIVELLELAGFESIAVRGIVLGYDAEHHRYLPLTDLDAPLSREDRTARAPERPDDSAIWWAEARRGPRAPRQDDLRRRTRELFARFRAYRLSQGLSWVGTDEQVSHLGRVIHAVRGESGPMLFGPYIPMPPGEWQAVFEVSSAEAGSQPPELVLGSVDVVQGSPLVTFGRVELRAGDLAGGRWLRVELPFAIPAMTMGVEFRVFTEGHTDLSARGSVDVRPVASPIFAPRRPRDRTKNWLRRHPRLKSLAKRVDRLLPGTR
jgi:SAM-dependent methyltransferase